MYQFNIISAFNNSSVFIQNNVFVLRKYTEVFRDKGHDVWNLFSDSLVRKYKCVQHTYIVCVFMCVPIDWWRGGWRDIKWWSKCSKILRIYYSIRLYVGALYN